MRPLTLALLTMSAIAVPAAAQQERIVIPGTGQGTITFFDREDFRGAALTFRSTDATVRVPFVIRSIRVEGDWRVCTGYSFQGRCVTINRDYRDSRSQLGISNTINSIQSLSGGYPGGGWYGQITGPQLRGRQSIFFAFPELNGRRIEACQGSVNYQGCGQRTAQRLCNHAGYRRVAYHEEERSGRRTYLADVLCTR